MRKAIIAVGVFGSVVALTIGVWYFLRWRSPRVFRQAEESLELEIRRDVSLGTDAQHVRSFLDAHRISYAQIDPTRDETEKSVWANDPWYAGARTSLQGYTQYIDTVVANCRLEVEFKFDKDDKLLGYRDHGSCKETLL